MMVLDVGTSSTDTLGATGRARSAWTTFTDPPSKRTAPGMRGLAKSSVTYTSRKSANTCVVIAIMVHRREVADPHRGHVDATGRRGQPARPLLYPEGHVALNAEVRGLPKGVGTCPGSPAHGPPPPDPRTGHRTLDSIHGSWIRSEQAHACRFFVEGLAS
jgi:hypothetical protein